MNFKKRKGFWEKIFLYPSFNKRFWCTVIFIIGILLVILLTIIFKLKLIVGTSDLISVFNLFIQTATLFLGVFAAYYALRQLVETRFNVLDETAMQELKRTHYSRAFEKWEEAFYIKPESDIYNNMCESLLLANDFNAFDQCIKISQGNSLINDKIFQEFSDKILIIYLKTIRHLLVENLGEAKKYIRELFLITKDKEIPRLNWDFNDLLSSKVYLDLNPDTETKKITDNLILYLKNSMQPLRKQDFEKGVFASQKE